ncbi:MAG: NAD-binding protein [Nostocoides sp.]
MRSAEGMSAETVEDIAGLLGAASLRCLVIGDLEATRMTCALLRAQGHTVTHLTRPSDTQVRARLSAGSLEEPGVPDAVVILVRSDVHALRWALLVEHVRPGLELVVSVFDRTVAQQLTRAIPHCRATSPAEVAAPAIVAAVTSSDGLAVVDEAHVVVSQQVGPGEAGYAPPRRTWWAAVGAWIPRRQAGSAGLMLAGIAVLLGILVVDSVLAVLVLHERPTEALYVATRIVATVGPADANLHESPGWYLLLSVIFMVAAIVATGMFVAGLVDWLLSPRGIGLIGRRALPRSGHVVLVGLGQVGLRTALLLRAMKVPVVVVERDRAAANLRLARTAGIPVVIGYAEDRAVMDRVGLSRAVGLAALGSDELDNVAVAISALAVVPQARIVIRAGEDDVIAETTSLFTIGHVVDVSALMAFSVVLSLSGRDPRVVFARPGHVGALCAEGPLEVPMPGRCQCRSEGF